MRNCISILKKWDFVILAIILLCSLLPVPFLTGNSGSVVTVSKDGQVIYTGSLSEDALIQVPGTGNSVRILNGKAYMETADCPDGICLQGHATALHPVVCLPNGISVTISASQGEEVGSHADAVTY